MNTNKIVEFVGQLMNSPSIKDLGASEKEEAIIAVINGKEQRFSELFSTADYCPGIPWEDVKSEILKLIGSKISEVIKPEIEDIIYKTIKSIPGCSDPDSYREKMIQLILKLSSRYNSRKTYSSVISFIESGLTSTYIDLIYRNRRSIYWGLNNRVEAVQLKSPEEGLDFMLVSLFLIPLYEISLPSKLINAPGLSGAQVFITDTLDNNILKKNFLGKIREIIKKDIPLITDDYLDILENIYDEESNDNKSLIPKFLKILFKAASEWKLSVVDRGADSFMLSWFNIARVNYKFYGYDYNIVDEMYKITLEEGL